MKLEQLNLSQFFYKDGQTDRFKIPRSWTPGHGPSSANLSINSAVLKCVQMMRVWLFVVCIITVNCEYAVPYTGSTMEEYALKIANCLALCTDKGATCKAQCNLYKACSGPEACSLRCPTDDTDCLAACQSFSRIPDCTAWCWESGEGRSRDLPTTIYGHTKAITTDVSTTSPYTDHVLLLDIHHNNTKHTVDWSLTQIDSGMYPGKKYEIRLYLFNNITKTCCTAQTSLPVGLIDVLASPGAEYHLPPNLLPMFDEGPQVYLNQNNNWDLTVYPRSVYYDEDKVGENENDKYVSYSWLAGSKSRSFLRIQQADLGIVTPVTAMSTRRPKLYGAGYVMNVYPDTDNKVIFTDHQDPAVSNDMIPQEVEFCAFVPNKDEESVVAATIQPTDGCVTWSDDGQYAVYSTIDLRNVQYCFRSDKTNGSILDIPCCENKESTDTECLRAEGNLTQAKFNRDYDYFVYLSYGLSSNSDFNVYQTCSSSSPCSGTYERLNPSLWLNSSSAAVCQPTPEPEKSEVVVYVLIAVAVAVVIAIGVLVWVYRKTLASLF